MKKSCLMFLSLYTLCFTLEYEGILFPSQHIVLSTLKSGIVITLPFKEGQYVKKGTVLLIQDPRQDSLQMILADREMEKSKIQKSNEVEKEVAFTLKEISYTNHFLRAPISGTIIKVLAKKHEYYSAGTKVIEIANLSKLITEISISPAKLSQVKKKGTTITVMKGNETTKGTFYAHNPLAEPGVELILVKLIMKNTHKWFAGTSVTVKF